MANMAKVARGRTTRPRRRFSAEFKEGAVRLVLDDKKAIRQVARDLDIATTSLTRWIEKEEVRRGIKKERPAPIELTVDERAELQELRKRVRELEVDKAILKKAAAFFAKENA
jgi:transposase